MNNKNVDNQSMLRVGTLLRNIYRIDAYLSSGGFGNTYLATNVEFHEQVAIKEFFMKGVSQRANDGASVFVSNSENIEQFNKQLQVFKREAVKLRKLSYKNNPHIVRVHDYFQENSTAYFVMDLIEGKSLNELLKEQDKPFSPDWLMDNILPQVLDALDVVHQQQIWHLDIKPSNIMLDAQGNAILIDFGSSKQIDPNTGDPTTIASMLQLSLPYAPSELIDCDYKKIGPWTDLYSLGGTLYHLATGKNPPKTSEINNDGLDAFKFLPDTNENFKKLVVWLMRPKIDNRPKSVHDVSQALSNNKLPDLQQADERTRVYRKPVRQPGQQQPGQQQPGQQPGQQYHGQQQPGQPYPGQQQPGQQQPGQQHPVQQHPGQPYLAQQHPGNIGSQAISSTPGKKSSSKTSLYVILAFLAAALLTAVLMTLLKPGTNEHKDGIGVDSAAVDSIMVTDFTYTFNKGEKAITFKYTGPMVNNLPNGEGKGVYDQGIYEGTYVDGMREGTNCKFTYTAKDSYRGDVYEGGYKNDRFDGECTYTQNDGFYFKGTAKNGDWYQGDWYNKDGKHVSRVVDGKEIQDAK